MTVSTLTTYNEAAAGGTVYYFTFRCDDASWVKTYIGGVLQSSGITVALNADQEASPGGSVTFGSATASTVRIERETPLTQETNYTAYDAFPAETHEKALDKLTVAMQDQKRDTVDVAADAQAAVAAETAARIAADAAIIAAGTGAVVDLSACPVTAVGSPTPRPLGEITADTFNVRAWGADPAHTGTVNSAAIQACIDAAATAGGTVYVPAGVYELACDTDLTLFSAMKVCFLMRSGMKIVADPGATFKIEDDTSTDGAPQFFAMFASKEFLTGLEWHGLTFDMNGANNLMSPSRATFPTAGAYNTYNQAAIHFAAITSGVSAGADDVVIDGCTFKDTAGVSFIVTGQEGGDAPSNMGKRWAITRCQFLNGGTDSSDHSCIYAWSEDVTVDGCVFVNPAPYAGETGGLAAYEFHGARQKFTNNIVTNFCRAAWLGGWWGQAVTSDNLICSGNIIEASYSGFGFFRYPPVVSPAAAGTGPVLQAIIENNIIVLQDASYLEAADSQAGIDLTTAPAGVTDIVVRGNYARKVGTVAASVFCKLAGATDTGTGYSSAGRFVVQGNTAYGFAFGVTVVAQATVGVGDIVIDGNSFFDLSQPDAPYTGNPSGIWQFANATPGPLSLTITNNVVADSRGTTQTVYGVLLEGIVQNLHVAGNVTHNVTTPYAETSPSFGVEGVRTGDLMTGFFVPSTTLSITSGAGGPTDNDPPIGSLYLRTDGSTSTTLYVKTGASTWTAK